MGVYEALKDLTILAQKADNIELYRQLLDVQAMALELQGANDQLKKQVDELSGLKKLEIAPGHTYVVDPVTPNRALCPVCTYKMKVLVPLESRGSGYCFQCKGNYR